MVVDDKKVSRCVCVCVRVCVRVCVCLHYRGAIRAAMATIPLVLGIPPRCVVCVKHHTVFFSCFEDRYSARQHV